MCDMDATTYLMKQLLAFCLAHVYLTPVLHQSVEVCPFQHPSISTTVFVLV